MASNEGRGPPPTVIESHATSNVGVSGSTVVVNPAWMERVSRSICGDQASCRDDLVQGIAAHEWSHVLDMRSPSAARPRLDRELAADRHAGRVLGRSGASPLPLLALLGAGSVEASATHPARAARVDATLAGHQQGESTRCDRASCTCS